MVGHIDKKGVIIADLRCNKSRKTQCYWSFLVLKRQTHFVQAKATNRRLKKNVRFVPRMMSRLVLFVVSLGALSFCMSRREISIFVSTIACAPPYDDPQPLFLMNIISLITAFSCPSHFHCALIGRLLRRHMRFSTRTDDRIP